MAIIFISIYKELLLSYKLIEIGFCGSPLAMFSFRISFSVPANRSGYKVIRTSAHPIAMKYVPVINQGSRTELDKKLPIQIIKKPTTLNLYGIKYWM